ncbi:uncharacterized protein LOC142533268 [Primulina tabacum]|uniref:uncharacterized protein LOC142533268 n=1 Tax=Primulina tabacum TaxID=48773 RepID=UPI003F59FC25
MLTSKMLKSIICTFLLATTIASSARILDEAITQVPLPDEEPDTSDPTPNNPHVGTHFNFTQPSGQFPATLPPNPSAPVVAPEPDISNTQTPPISNMSPQHVTGKVTTPATTTTTGGAATSTASGSTTAYHHTLSLFMHDILGGSHPSGREMTGIVANSNANNLPFSKPNNQIFPINSGVPLNTINGFINNNFPSLIGLNGSPTNTLLQNNGNNNIINGGNNQALITAGQLPAGVTLQQLKDMQPFMRLFLMRISIQLMSWKQLHISLFILLHRGFYLPFILFLFPACSSYVFP